MTEPIPEPPTTALELQAQIQAERTGSPFLVYREAGARQVVLLLDPGLPRLTVGRGAADIALEWDGEVSRLHAALELMGPTWTIADDGLSTNGTFVNGERIAGRRLLEDRDTIRVGRTQIRFRAPLQAKIALTARASQPTVVPLSDTQRRVLIGLCRPFLQAGQFATPATNKQIADELFLGVDAIKSHMRALFEKFGIEHLPHNQKRARLVELALQSGLVSERDLQAPPS